jgi:hypothetical protein
VTFFIFRTGNFKDHAARIEKYTELAARAAESSGKRGSFLKLSGGPTRRVF